MNAILRKSMLMAVLASTALYGCGGGGGGSDSGDGGNNGGNGDGNGGGVEVQRVSLTGFAVKGLLRNAPVTAATLSGTVLETTRTDANGQYELADIEHDGSIFVTLTTDSQTQVKCDAPDGCASAGSTVNFGTFYPFNDANFELTAVLPSSEVAEDQKLMVTPITHLAAQRVKEDGATSPEAIQGTIQATAKLVGLEGVDINADTPADVTDPANMNDSSAGQQKYGAILASVQAIAEESATQSVADVINDLTDDYVADGGLKNNDDDTGTTVSLQDIFEESAEVLEKSEEVAEDQGVELDTTEATQAIEQEEQKAETAEEDETTVDVVPVEVVVTKEEATVAALGLLEDLNTWHAALTAESNSALTAPHEDQVNGVGELFNAIDDTSGVLSAFYAYVIADETMTEEYCFEDVQGQQQCFTGEYTESRTGPVFGVIEEVSRLASFAGFIRENAPDATSYDLPTAIAAGLDNDFVGRDDQGVIEPEGTLTATISGSGNDKTYTFVRNYTDDEGEVVSYTATLQSEESGLTAIIKVIDFTATVTPSAASGDQPFVVAKGSDSADFGKVELTYKDQAAFDAFLAGGINDETDLVNIAADYNLIVSDSASTPTQSFALVADIDATNVVNATEVDKQDITLDASIQINGMAANDETIVGTLTLDFDSFAEEIPDEEGTFWQVGAGNAEVNFTGAVTAKGQSEAGNAVVAEFDGMINANAAFFLDASLDETVAENAEAKISVNVLSLTETVAGSPQVVKLENAEVSATAGVLKLPNGEVFDFDGEEQYNITEMSVVGKLTSENATGSASIGINAVVNADLAGLPLVNVSLPEEGDQIATLDYELTTHTKNATDDTLRIAADLLEAAQEIATQFAAVGAEQPTEAPPVAHLESTLDQCIDVEGEYKYCRTVFNARFVPEEHISTPADLTLAERATYALNEALEHSDVNEHDSLAEPSRLPFGVNDVALDTSECTGGAVATSCRVTATYTSESNYSFPMGLAETQYPAYLRGLTNINFADDVDEYELTSACTNNGNDPLDWACGVTRVDSNDRHAPDVATMTDAVSRDRILQGFNEIKRHVDVNSCTTQADNSQNCEVYIESYGFSVQVTPQQAIDYNTAVNSGVAADIDNAAAPIIAAIDTGSIPAFGQTVADGSINYCDESSGRCDLGLPSFNTMLTVPATVPNDHYIRQAYLSGLYPVHSIANVICDVESCDWDVVEQYSVNYQSPAGYSGSALALNDIVALRLAQETHSNLDISTSCDAGTSDCAVTIVRNSYREIPAGIVGPLINEYVAATLLSPGPVTKPVSYDFNVPCDADEYDGKLYCPAILVQETVGNFVPVLDTTDDTALLRGSLALAISQVWPDVIDHGEAEFGGDNVIGYQTNISGIGDFLTTTSDMSYAAPITLTDKDIEFDAEQFETEDAYVQLSASLLIEGAVTSLDDAEINIFAQRNGQEDAKGHIRFSYGNRAIDLAIDSLAADLTDVAHNRLIIKNQSTEMVINVDCVTTDEDFSDAQDNACSGDFEFEGTITVGEHEVGTLEDRDGIPVFAFDSGDERQLVVVPQFMIESVN